MSRNSKRKLKQNSKGKKEGRNIDAQENLKLNNSIIVRNSNKSRKRVAMELITNCSSNIVLEIHSDLSLSSFAVKLCYSFLV